MSIISATQIRKSFGQNEVLQGIDFVADRGEVVAVLGASGSGKSTFLRCLNLLEIPEGGELDLLGESIGFRLKKGVREVNAAQVRRLRKKIAMVFQHFNLWQHMTALQNVMEVPLHVLRQNRKEATEKARSCLEMVGMSGFEKSFPLQLSGGQQQRLGIARALAVDPEVILFDEPTSSLDPELVQGVLQIIARLAEGKITMLVVTHEIAFARKVAHRVLFLHEGRVGACEETERLFKAPTAEFSQFIQHSHQ